MNKQKNIENQINDKQIKLPQICSSIPTNDNRNLKRLIRNIPMQPTLKDAIKINQSIKSNIINDLYLKFDFTLILLKMAALILKFNNLSITQMNLLKYYWFIEEERIDNYDEIEKYKLIIDQIEMSSNEISKKVFLSALKCVACKINTVSILYLPCGHLLKCTLCFQSNSYNKSDKNTCEECNIQVKEAPVIFL